MYTIYADDLCFYNDVSDLDELRLGSPNLNLEDNSSGKFTFTLPYTNIAYSLIECLSTKLRVLRNGVEIWSGRAIQEKRDFYGNRQMTCEGELGYFNDTIQPQKEYLNPTIISFLTDVLAIHNEKVGEDRRFVLGNVTVTGRMKNEGQSDSEESETEPDEDIYVYTDFQKTLEVIKTKLVDYLGGHLVIRKENGVRYLDYLENYIGTVDQVIEFGTNLLDFVINYDETDFCTVVIPLGAKYDITAFEWDEYVDITDVNDGKNYLINQDSYEHFGWIERIEHFDDIEDENELKAKGQEFLQDLQFNDMELEISAMDMNYLDVNVEEMKMLYQVEVRSVWHGLDRFFPVTAIQIPLDNPANTKYTLGNRDKQVRLSDYTGMVISNAIQQRR